MEIRVKKLLDAFLQKGWEFVGPVDTQSDWWFSDILQLTSRWKPAGTPLYLTLLTDPQIPNEKVVWSVGMSSVIPENRHHQFIDQLTLNDINRVDLTGFVDKINKFVLTLP